MICNRRSKAQSNFPFGRGENLWFAERGYKKTGGLENEKTFMHALGLGVVCRACGLRWYG